MHITYSVEIQHNNSKSIQHHTAGLANNQKHHKTTNIILDKNTFINDYYSSCPDSGENIWNRLFGNLTTTDNEHPHDKYLLINNPNYQYLTQDASEIIQNNLYLFDSGIDFERLPQGFYLTINPATGIKNVLAYHESWQSPLSQNDQILAIDLNNNDHEQQDNQNNYQNKCQQQWYGFLLSKRQRKNNTAGSPQYYCKIAQLNQAFTIFSNLLNQLDLQFYQANFDLAFYQQDFHPIVLLSRWQTVLTQSNLKKCNLEAQWLDITKLDFTVGSGPIRYITDKQYTPEKCGFVINEMFDADNQHKQDLFIELSRKPQDTIYPINLYRDALEEISDNAIQILRNKHWQDIQNTLVGNNCTQKILYQTILASKNINISNINIKLKENDQQFVNNLIASLQHIAMTNNTDSSTEEALNNWRTWVKVIDLVRFSGSLLDCSYDDNIPSCPPDIIKILPYMTNPGFKNAVHNYISYKLSANLEYIGNRIDNKMRTVEDNYKKIIEFLYCLSCFPPDWFPILFSGAKFFNFEDKKYPEHIAHYVRDITMLLYENANNGSDIDLILAYYSTFELPPHYASYKNSFMDEHYNVYMPSYVTILNNIVGYQEFLLSYLNISINILDILVCFADSQKQLKPIDLAKLLNKITHVLLELLEDIHKVSLSITNKQCNTIDYNHWVKIAYQKCYEYCHAEFSTCFPDNYFSEKIATLQENKL
jgi:hypothetical protein